MIPKFRAWVKPEILSNHMNGVIAEAKPDFIERVCLVKRDDLIGNECFDEIFDFDDVILMQSTGLLNCETEDGKIVEGWEGDIADVGWSEQTGDFNSHRIILKSPFDYSTDEARWLIHAEYIIIRGNIYENPELLEGRE